MRLARATGKGWMRGAGVLTVAGLVVGFGARVWLRAAPEAIPEREWAIPARLAPQSLLLDVAVRDGVMVAVGERGHVLVSRDRGARWTQAAVPTRALLTAVHMHDASTGWAVGHDEVILRTRDGGLTWERVHLDPEKERPHLDVWFADARRGVAIGAYGGMLVTRDGGDTWTARTAREGDDAHLNHLAASADGTLYMAAEAGHLYRSDDGGETWVGLPSPYQGSFFGVLPLSDGSVLVYGLRGHVFRTVDRGQTWQQLPTDTEATLMAGLELGPGRFVLAGTAGAILWSTDDGRALRLQELPDRKAIVALALAEDHRLLTFGEGGVHTVEIPR